jgi:pentatricopeptide repeat protein
MNNVGNLLRTIIQLEKANLSKKSGFNYQVDLGTLEHLSATAAKKGRSDVILLVWEYMEVMRLSEENSNCITLSQSMHESAAQAFACSSKKEDHMIFNLFAEMDEQGYETNRALLKSISRSMRTRVTVRRIDNMKWILKNHGKNDNYYNTSKPTSAALNCILACYGQLGEVQKALETFDEFDHLGCQTTPETFEFIMEGIRENTTTAVPPFLHGIGTNYVGNENEDNFEEWRLSQLETAEVVLLTCLEQGHQVNMYMLNNYIQILCTAGELQKAKEFLSELIESEKEHVQEFSPQCFSILALSYAQRGFRDETQEVINMCTEVGLSDHFPKHVMERIATL